MSRYVTRSAIPIGVNANYAREMCSIDVVEHEMCKTGLVDMQGRDIYRAPNAIGFHAKIEA